MPHRLAPQVLQRALQHTIRWVLDQPQAPELVGQCCDRLRPAPVLRELEQALQRCGNGLVTLVDWRWDGRLGCAEGFLWRNHEVQRFLWWRASDRLELHSQLRCTPSSTLRRLA